MHPSPPHTQVAAITQGRQAMHASFLPTRDSACPSVVQERDPDSEISSIPSYCAEKLDDYPQRLFGRNRWSRSSVEKPPGEGALQKDSVLVLHLPWAGRARGWDPVSYPVSLFSDSRR